MAEPTDKRLVNENAAASYSNLIGEERILALEIRLSKFGFVVFDGPNEILDFKVRRYAGQGAHRRSILETRIRSLLDLYAPCTIVLRRRSSSSRHTREKLLSVVCTIRTIARSRSTQLHVLDSRKVKSFFSEHRCTTKHEIASLIANWFEQLSWRLPPNRKVWQKEAYFMPIFDAAATGVVFFDEQGKWNGGVGCSGSQN